MLSLSLLAWSCCFHLEAARSARVVVVLDGAAVRVQEEALRSIVDHVVRPLRARAFATWQGASVEPSVATIKQRFGIEAVVEPDVLPADFITWDVPRLANDTFRTVFYNAYTKYRSYESVKKLDFDWLIYTRSDMHWFADVPPMPLWRNTSVVWVPDSADWGGIYDRTALIPRRYAQAYLQGPFRALVAPPAALEALFGDDPWVTSEKLLHKVLLAAGAHFGSFPIVGTISRCRRNTPECQLHINSPEQVEQFAQWRYYHEYVDSMYASMYANLPGSRWALTKGRRDINPNCWHSESGFSKQLCCGVGDDPDGCFDAGNFYTKRRCCDFLPYLTIRTAEGGSVCWSLSSVEHGLEKASDAFLRGLIPWSCLPH
eukprot:TRINITY_DN26643_c0_g6_i1.p1 TRINITY_DN26643_c0_g6~~TRINITY_DN26643_c0_g6_i1.p1  ORF type:complete len:373 (-),score=56.23 TRINITY_DN26643_c0_g6_i1:79-1197(-)